MLELDGLTRRFGQIVALDDLSFGVPAGQVCGFLGPNGAGKTTAMRIIFGIAQPDSGRVLWQGKPIDPQVRLRFGYMPEERGLYPGMVVGEQLVYLARLHGMSRTDALQSASYWLDRLGVAERGGDRVEALSLGNQQRVQLASAFIHRPELMVFDEPFSGLDPVGIEALSGLLRDEAAAGRTVLFSSHQLDLVEHVCDSVAIINRGRLVATGSVQDLTARGRQRLAVEVDGNRDGSWAARLKGVTVVDNTDGRLRLELNGVDPQKVLAAARRAGPVRHFGVERRRLSEVFREAVSR